MTEEKTFGVRLKHAWNAFRNREPTEFFNYTTVGQISTTRQDRVRLRPTNEKSIIAAVYNRIALDVASVDIQHVRLDSDGRYEETIDSSLNYILTTEANIDQTSRAFIQDVVLSMFDEGCVAIVATDTSIDPKISKSYEIFSLRTGKILEWAPRHVRVRVYNDKTGSREDIVLPKESVAIIENPLYAVMNEPNGTLKRLINKLNLLDSVDEQSSSGKLDIIIQLPYTIRSEARRKQADERRKDIEMQLMGSKYGIAYADATEKITQLNRPSENNLMSQVEYLTKLVYSQLGISESVFDGTANETDMLNYNNRTIEPIISAIVDGMKRVFLTKTARTQGQSIMWFRHPFKFVPATELANIADKFTRNEILTSNEFRPVIGYKPSKDPRADELRNKNLNPAKNSPNGDENQNGMV